MSGRLAGFGVCWFSGAIFPSAVAEMSVMREAVPVEGAKRSVFEPLQLSAVRDPADGVERGLTLRPAGGEPLARSLSQAQARCRESRFLRELLPREILRAYAGA